MTVSLLQLAPTYPDLDWQRTTWSLHAPSDDVLTVLTFPGGEPHVNVHRPEYVAGKAWVIDLRYESFNDLGTALVLNDALRRNRASLVFLYCPYLPGARQDRHEKGSPLTAKVYADIINAAGFDQVFCIDPHSAVMPALIDNLDIIGAEEVISFEFLTKRRLQDPLPTIVCPDAGAAKRAEAVAAKFGQDVVYASKTRDPQTGKLSNFSCPQLPANATAIVVDDICDGGWTFTGLGKAIGLPKDQMRLWTTFGIYSKGLTVLHDWYGKIGCTDGFPPKSEPDKVLHTTSFLLNHLTTYMGARR